MEFVDGLLERAPIGQVPVGESVVNWLRQLETVFEDHAGLLNGNEMSDQARRLMLDQLGEAYSSYRSQVYDYGTGRDTMVDVAELRGFLAAVRPHLDHVAEEARRPDGLVDAYRLLRLSPGIAELESLPLMLEGQVAALGSSNIRFEGGGRAHRRHVRERLVSRRSRVLSPVSE